MDQHAQQQGPIRPKTNGEITIFDDTPPPQVYYSPRAINVFSIIFSTLFGMVLMAMNLNKTEKGKKGTPWVIGFGIAYTALTVSIMTYTPRTRGLNLVFGAIGGYVLSNLFWDKYIGKGAPYSKRSVAAPAIIGIVITLAFFGLIIWAVAQGWEI